MKYLFMSNLIDICGNGKSFFSESLIFLYAKIKKWACFRKWYLVSTFCYSHLGHFLKLAVYNLIKLPHEA